MKIEEQVLSIEQMQHLNELGLKVEDTALCWWEFHTDEFVVMPVNCVPHGLYYRTLTLQEILELLPARIELFNTLYFSYERGSIAYIDYDGFSVKDFEMRNEPLKGAYNMLCWVLDNGYLLNNKED